MQVRATTRPRRAGTRALVISTIVCPALWSCPTAKVLVQSATPGVADRVATAFPRASAIDRLERVAVGHLAPNEVLERPRSSTSAGVLDGLGYWR